ncbi:MAG: phosphate ABC transporter substrate-binding protein [Synergistaceae bacterium]|jgi:phosphate transport system substrate-binding protein|nr:phosphate ABC transporter substrate-binding protein [Synergistaceae bacterium]
MSNKKRSSRKSVWNVFAVALLVVLGIVGMASAAEIVVNGSTTVLPFAQIAVERFAAAHPEVKISISGGGTGNGIKGLIDKTTHIANASRGISGSEVEQAKAKGVTPFETTVALDCIVPLVHPSNPVKNLTFAQLKKIYTGEVENWKDVGGEDARIAVVGRDSSSGTYGTWQELVVEKGDKERKSRVTARAQVTASSGAMLTTVAGNKYAIGYDGIGYVDKTVKAVSVEGIEASIATAKDNSYPMSRNLYMYTDGEPSGDIKAFIDYVLSADGQKIVTDTGFISLR